MTARYLAAGANKLKPGHSYVITVYGRVDGTYRNAAMTRDVPLIYFDDERRCPATCAGVRGDPTCGAGCGTCASGQVCMPGGCVLDP